MTKFDDIYEEAIDNHGLITSARAVELGVSNNELVQYARRGRIEKVGHGLYRLVRRVPENNDGYALAVALVGPDAFLYGESVIGMLNLAPSNPNMVHVGTSSRMRRALDKNIVVHRCKKEGVTAYDGIASQSASAAIRSCLGTIMPERLMQAANTAHKEGYISASDYKLLTEVLES